jgi:hypothetical protein
METMHLAARLLIEQNKHHMTAFSARPDSPVQPVTPARPSLFSAVRAGTRRVRALGRSPVRPMRTSRLGT